jgi:hypothetical protein
MPAPCRRKCRRESIIADDSARNRRRLQPLPGADRAADTTSSHDTATEENSPPKIRRSSPVFSPWGGSSDEIEAVRFEPNPARAP